jgi:K+-transporting ATPase ATPase B chain
LFDPSILRRAIGEAFVKLDPRKMVRIPVMFVVEIGSVITSIEFIARADLFVGLVTLWLWATVLFANFAEAVAEGRGQAQADTLRRSRKETFAQLLKPDGTTQEIPSAQLRSGDLAVVTAGQVIPGDGDVVQGMAVVDESAITGESAPVIRESGGDRSAVTGGTVVLSDRIVVQITSNPGETFLDRMIALVEGASRQTPNEIALDILIAGLTLILLVAAVTVDGHLRPGHPVHGRPGRAVRLPRAHHDRRPAVGDRHRRDGPDGATERAGDVRTGRRGRRGRLYAPAR